MELCATVVNLQACPRASAGHCMHLRVMLPSYGTGWLLPSGGALAGEEGAMCCSRCATA